ncbi:hypothetical protein KR044_002523, partial [Drosophila immigrans]
LLTDRKEFASTILWLEDQKIRLYTIEDRDKLRCLDDLKLWEAAYVKYCSDLSMPHLETQLEQLTWIVGHAIRLEYLDDPAQYGAIQAQDQTKNKGPTVGQQKVQTIFDGKINVNDQEFVAAVRQLANKLQLPQHPNHLLQLEAIARIVHERLSLAAKDRKPITGTPFPFDKGNDIVVAAGSDAVLDYPMRILRLLQIQSLRQLQTQINETIVAVQSLTANPKTDTKLGKVGR